MTPLQLSRYKLQAFLECQRRFQLRYVNKVGWPTAPVPSGLSEAFAQGELFHRLLEQHFRGLSAELPPDADNTVKQWWRNFQQQPPNLPAGTRYPEIGLSVPIAPIDLEGGHYLFGRFDLLILSEQSAHIFDWKTERFPRSRGQLAEDWQTRLYQTMVVEGSNALGYSYSPEQVHLTYWFANAPERSVTFDYTQAQHVQNWAQLKASVERIDRRLAAPNAIWPLTENLDTCRRCAFANYCGRDVTPVATDELTFDAAAEDEVADVQLEPVPANTL